MKTDVKCEIKTTSRWQKDTVNKRVIATEPNHLTVDSFRKKHLMLLRDAKQLLGIIFCWRNGAKTGNMVSKA